MGAFRGAKKIEFERLTVLYIWDISYVELIAVFSKSKDA